MLSLLQVHGGNLSAHDETAQSFQCPEQFFPETSGDVGFFQPAFSSAGHWWKSRGNMLASRRLLAAFNSTGAYASKTCQHCPSTQEMHRNMTQVHKRHIERHIERLIQCYIIYLNMLFMVVLLFCRPLNLEVGDLLASGPAFNAWLCLGKHDGSGWKRHPMPCYASDSTEAVQTTSKILQKLMKAGWITFNYIALIWINRFRC